MLTGTVFLDFTGSLAILAMLAVAYGGLHRVLPDKRWFAPLLGTLFGVLAFVQMHNPVEPFPGLIIDMRNVPIVLAGAFLGGRGLLPCLLIAVVARAQIGGVGMTSAFVAFAIAGGVGLLWQGLTQGRPRGLGAFAALGAATNLHLIGAVLLPIDLMAWFLWNAAPVLIAMNLLAIPIVASLLERERCQIRREDHLVRTAGFAVGEGLMGRDALDWSLDQAATTGSLQAGATAIGIRIRFQGALARFWGNDADTVAMKVFHERLKAVMPAGGLVGWGEEDLVVMAVPQVDAEGARQLVTQIRRDVSSNPIALPGMVPFRLVLDMDVRHYRDLPVLDRIVEDLAPDTASLRPARRPTAKQRVRFPAPEGFAVRVEAQNELFSTFDRLRAARYDVG